MNRNSSHWAFILGGSSGVGFAAAKRFSQKGLNLFIIHRDRRSHIADFENEINTIRSQGIRVVTINMNANQTENKTIILEKLKEALQENAKIKLFLHSIADGNVKPVFDPSANAKFLTEDDYAYTIQSMGSSFASWAVLLQSNNLFAEQASIIGISSEGAHHVLKNYAAVGSAKAVIETSCKYLAVELAPYNINSNVINAGVMESPALKVIPGYENLLSAARKRNPYGRLTTPEDIAKVIDFLASDDGHWINGSVIRVDGGEQLTSL
jgi:enoyl-[acyl-carrier protein] reductase III